MKSKRPTKKDKAVAQGCAELARPLTCKEVAQLKPLRATEPPPAGSILSGCRTIFVSGPAGKLIKPIAKAKRVTTVRRRDVWQVDVALLGTEANPRLPLRMKRIPVEKLRAAALASTDPSGFRPPWADVTFQLRGVEKVEKPPERPLHVKGRRVRPLYIFDDRRRLVTNANYPWWCIGLVKSNRGTGTGTLVGDNIFLTAGHVVPWGDPNPWMTFSPAWNVPDVNFGEWPCIRVQGVEVSDPPQDSDHVGNDVAVVQLQASLGRTLGFWGSNAYNDDWDGAGYWTSVGYPDDWNGNPTFEDSDTVEDADSEGDGLALETEASLTHGNSGGPFCGWFHTDKGPDPRVVGVVSAEGAEAEIPRDHDNFLAGGDIMTNLIAWARANMTVLVGGAVGTVVGGTI